IDALTAAESVSSQGALIVRLLDGALENLVLDGELAPDVDVAPFGTDRVTGQGAPFKQRVPRPAHDLPVLERPGLRFVGVAAEVVRLAAVLRHERPLEAGREPGAAPSAQSGVLDLLDHRFRRHAQGLLEPFVAAALHPAIEAARTRVSE